MQIIEISTLIDITNTNVNRPNQGDQLKINQNKNFLTLLQCVGIRSIVSYDTKPTCETIDLKNLGFGNNYKGKHNVWSFKFSPDRADVYIDNEGDSIGLLVSDIHGTPVIKNLSETINIDKAVFDLKDSTFKNTIIKALQGTI